MDKKWKYVKPSASERLTYDLFCRQSNIDQFQFPLERLVRDDLGTIEDAYRIARYADLGNTILGWACYSLVYRSRRTGEEETVIIEYTIVEGRKIPTHSFLAVRNAS